MQTDFLLAPAGRTRTPRNRRKDPARLASLPQVLGHRDLARPMCCWATNSTSPRGRIYLDQELMLEDDGLNGAEDHQPRDGEAHRPLSLLPRLHDDPPVGRQLHAPRRSWRRQTASIYRCPLQLSGCCAASSGVVLTRPDAAPRGLACRSPRNALPWADAAAVAPTRRIGVADGSAGVGDGPAADFPRPRGCGGSRVALLSGCCAQQVLMRRDQRGDDPAVGPAWLRGIVVAPGSGRCCGRACSPSGRRSAGGSTWPAPISTLGSSCGYRAGSTRSSSTPRAVARSRQGDGVFLLRTDPA